MNDNDTHRLILQLVYEYVKANIDLDNKATLGKTIKVRKLLSEIRQAASLRRNEIMDIQKQRREYLDTLKDNPDSTEAEGTDD